MIQASLFDDPPTARLAYQGATPTARACSRAAAVAAQSFSPSQRQRVLEHYRRCGFYGSTDAELSAATGVSRASLCQRRAELMRAGQVEDAKRWRKHGRCACTVYRIVERPSCDE